VTWQDLWKVLLDLVYGHDGYCTLCGRKIREKEPVCSICRRNLAYLRAGYEKCTLCGRFILHGKLCVDCGEAAPVFLAVRTLGPYRGELKETLQRFKYRGQRSIAAGFAYLMAETLQSYLTQHRVDLIIPVPMYWRKQQSRNYNQANLLARELAHYLKVPLADSILLKVKDNPSQTKLAKEQRMANVSGVFRVASSGAVKDKNILLVDDIITTGSTISECAKMLTFAGAKEINVVSVAAGITASKEESDFDIGPA